MVALTEWTIIKTKGEYEPWWFFEDWEETILDCFRFNEKEEAFKKYKIVAEEMIQNYPHHALKKQVLFAAWNEEEIEYCEDCEDDIQTFHGLILMEDGKVYTPELEEVNTWFSEVAAFETKPID